MANEMNPSNDGKMKKRIAGTALVALPVAGVVVYLQVQKAVQKGNREAVKGFAYDKSALAAVDPALIKWKMVGQYQANVPEAMSMTADASGGIWVGGKGTVQRIAGGDPAQIKIDGTARAIAVDASGSVYVAMTDHVEIFGSDGVRKGVLPSLGEKALLVSIAVGEDAVYVGDFGNRVVHRMDKTGKVLKVIGKEDASKGQKGLLLPSPHMDVAIAKNGTVWVADTGRHQLENYTPEGNMERFWGKSGTGIGDFVGCCNPADFWLMQDGTFVTSEKGLGRVKIFDGDGQLESVVATSADFPENVTGYDVSADGKGRIVVLARESGMVKVFERK